MKKAEKTIQELTTDSAKKRTVCAEKEKEIMTI